MTLGEGAHGRWLSRGPPATPAERRPLAVGECPSCRRAIGHIYANKGPVQYRKCPGCGFNFKTVREIPPPPASTTRP